MRVAIAGAGAVGTSIAKELIENGHEVMLIDKDPKAIKVYEVAGAEWLLADACELLATQAPAEVGTRKPRAKHRTYGRRCTKCPCNPGAWSTSHRGRYAAMIPTGPTNLPGPAATSG